MLYHPFFFFILLNLNVFFSHVFFNSSVNKPVVLQSHPNKCIVEDYIELKDCLCERLVYRFDCSFVLFFRICLL